MSSELLVEIKKILRIKKIYNLLHYRVISDHERDSFDDCSVELRISKMNVVIVRERGSVYIAGIKLNNSSKSYDIRYVIASMKDHKLEDLARCYDYYSEGIEKLILSIVDDMDIIAEFIKRDDSEEKIKKAEEFAKIERRFKFQ